MLWMEATNERTISLQYVRLTVALSVRSSLWHANALIFTSPLLSTRALIDVDASCIICAQQSYVCHAHTNSRTLVPTMKYITLVYITLHYSYGNSFILVCNLVYNFFSIIISVYTCIQGIYMNSQSANNKACNPKKQLLNSMYRMFKSRDRSLGDHTRR